jgi:anti-sigma factor RsiW
VSITSENMQKLMAYADGELEGDERAEAEALLAADPDAQRFVGDLRGLGGVVRLGHEERFAGAIASFDVADAVMARVERETPDAAVVRPAADIVSLEAAREKRAQRMKLGAGVVAALAAAAAVIVVARGPAEAPLARTPEPVPADSLSGVGIEVDAVESPEHSVSVFYLPRANELGASVVVWVEETGEK